MNNNNGWNKYHLIIENIDGEYQISLSDIIKDSINVFNDNGYNKILDLGCGTGRNSFFYAQNGFDVFASDICKKSTDVLNNKIYKNNISNIKVYNYDFTDILFKDRFFDAVVCTSVLHHAKLKDIKKGINEIYRVLKPNGCLICDILSKEDSSYGLGKTIEENTFVGSREGEEGIPHHYTDMKELQNLMEKFCEVRIHKNEYIINNKYTSKVFDVISFKN